MISQWVARGWFRTVAGTSMVLASLNGLVNWIVVPESGALGAAVVAAATSALWILTNGGLVWWLQRRSHAMASGDQ
jgi:hypothetical protein